MYDGNNSIERNKITFQNNTDLLNNTHEGFNDTSSDGTSRNNHNKMQLGLRNQMQNQTMLNLPSTIRPSGHFDDIGNQGSP